MSISVKNVSKSVEWLDVIVDTSKNVAFVALTVIGILALVMHTGASLIFIAIIAFAIFAIAALIQHFWFEPERIGIRARLAEIVKELRAGVAVATPVPSTPAAISTEKGSI